MLSEATQRMQEIIFALVKWNEQTAGGTKLCRAQWTNFGGGMLDENRIWP